MTDVKTEEVVKPEIIKEAEISKEQPAKEILPSMFSKVGEEIHINADIVYLKETGEIHTLVKSGTLVKEKLKSLGIKQVEFVFTRPDYDDILTYRSRCSVANGNTGTMIVDTNKLRYFLVLKHLKFWDLKDDKGEIIKLDFEDGTLTSESVKIVYSVNPKILDGIFTLLEGKFSI